MAMTASGGGESVLSAPLTIEYPFRRTTGPVIGAFLTGLREGVILGIRAKDGSVICPPVEYDPGDASSLSELVRVGEEGEVVGWSWNGSVLDGQPLDHPFAWALIRLDGADTAMLQAVDAPKDAMATGMRVRVRWAAERSGVLSDIACFEPVGG